MFFRTLNRWTTNRGDNFANDLMVEDYIARFTNAFRSNAANSLLIKGSLKRKLSNPKVSRMQHRVNAEDDRVNNKNKHFKRRCF